MNEIVLADNLILISSKFFQIVMNIQCVFWSQCKNLTWSSCHQQLNMNCEV